MTPPWFTSLRQFPDLWDHGLPALTYHKVGPRPWRVRLRGLYLSPNLFRRQLTELAAAGATFLTPDDLPLNPQPPRGIFLTFDDGFANTFHHALPALIQHRATAIQFLVADRLGRLNGWEIAQGETPERLMDISQVREWLAAGQRIGAHTRTHPHLPQIPLRQARDEIFGSKKKLEDLFNQPIHHFCYPYGDLSDPILDLVAEAGFRTAWTTRPAGNRPETDPLQLGRFTARGPTLRLFPRRP
ncbi:MAG: polysaccharide deacetylase family protein [Verrucomicrobiia bacterium]